MPSRDDLPIFSRRLREAREAAGLSQRNLGIEAGLDAFVASTRVNRYETGVHQPDLQTTRNLAKVLGVPVAYFYAEDDKLAAVTLGFHRGDRKLKDKLLNLSTPYGLERPHGRLSRVAEPRDP